jgi:hypothetical protein
MSNALAVAPGHASNNAPKMGPQERMLLKQLLISINTNNFKEMEKLVKDGAPINSVGEFGETALTKASGEGDTHVVASLLDQAQYGQ